RRLPQRDFGARGSGDWRLARYRDRQSSRFTPMGALRQPPIRGSKAAEMRYGRASRIMLNGVSVARLMLRNPPAPITSRSFASPACAPSAAPISCDIDVGTHTIVDAP